MNKQRKCRICGYKFVPDRFHPYQKVCSRSECQHKRQLLDQKNWRQKNPEYFKYKEKRTPWERKRAAYLRLWRRLHKDYFKKYSQKHSKNA